MITKRNPRRTPIWLISKDNSRQKRKPKPRDKLKRLPSNELRLMLLRPLPKRRRLGGPLLRRSARRKRRRLL